MLFTITQSYKRYAEVETPPMYNPQTDVEEPLLLVLYQKEINHSDLLIQYFSKPTATYRSLQTKEEIPLMKWTEEMTHFFEAVTPAYPTPKRGFKVGWAAKFSLIVLLALAGVIGYKAMSRQMGQATLRELPAVGNRYKLAVPVELLNAQGKVTGFAVEEAWCEVVASQAEDSTCVLSLATLLTPDKRLSEAYAPHLETDKTLRLRFKPGEHRLAFYLTADSTLPPLETVYTASVEDVKQ